MGQAEERCGMDFPGLLQEDLMKRLGITILFRSAEPYFFCPNWDVCSFSIHSCQKEHINPSDRRNYHAKIKPCSREHRNSSSD